jgi:hypothetical protein
MSAEKFTRWMECFPSRNWIRKEPSRNYGISTMRMVFYVKGPKGVIQWMIGTEWGIKPVRDHLENFAHHRHEFRAPTGWDLGYHSLTPHYEGQTIQDKDCKVLGAPCYYDGSGLNADDLIEGFLAGGTDWLWPKLEEYYACTFECAPYPDFTAHYLPHPDDKPKTEAAE